MSLTNETDIRNPKILKFETSPRKQIISHN
jgi:hypothetical protein